MSLRVLTSVFSQLCLFRIQIKIAMGLCVSVLTLVLLALGVFQGILSEKLLLKDVALSSLESGFEGIKASGLLSSPFFFLAVLFVLFDLELILLFPGVVGSEVCVEYVLFWGSTMALILLTLALEWAWYGLKWQM